MGLELLPYVLMINLRYTTTLRLTKLISTYIEKREIKRMTWPRQGTAQAVPRSRNS